MGKKTGIKELSPQFFECALVYFNVYLFGQNFETKVNNVSIQESMNCFRRMHYKVVIEDFNVETRDA